MYIKRLFIVVLIMMLFAIPSTVFAQTFESKKFETKVGDPKPAPPSTAATPNKEGFVFYCQADPQWSNSCFMSTAGCGPTSAAMIISSLGLPITPPQIDEIFRSSAGGNARKCDKVGSNEENFIGSGWLQNNGFTIQAIAKDSNERLNLDMAKQFIDNGYLILGSSLSFPCPSPGWCTAGIPLSHIFTVDSVDPITSNINARDPVNCRSEHPEEYESNRKIPNNFPWLFAYAIKKIK